MATIAVAEFDGNDISSATYFAYFDAGDNPLSRSVRPVETAPIGRYPRPQRFAQQAKPIVVHVDLLSPSTENMEALQAYFPIGRRAPLVVTYGAVRRIFDVRVIKHIPYDGNLAAASFVLQAADPRARSELTQLATLTQTSKATDVVSVTNDGNDHDDSLRIFQSPYTIKPVATAQRYKREIILANRADASLDHYAIDLTDGGWDHAAEVSAGRSIASGDDVRVLIDGREVPRYAGDTNPNDWNDTATKIWINADYGPHVSATLALATTAATPLNGGELEVDTGDLADWPRTGFLMVGSECISYHGITRANENGVPALLNVVRGARNTTRAVHALNATLSVVEHRIQLVYGWTGAGAPADATAFEPMINLNTSTNSSHVWPAFSDDSNPQRSMQWTPQQTVRDLQYDKIIAAAGSPDTALDWEWHIDGAQANKPAANEWFQTFPTGLVTGGAAPSFVASGSVSVVNTTTMTVPVPSGTADGDLMMLGIYHQHISGAASITTPTGWTLIGVADATDKVAAFYHRTASGEPGTFDVTLVGGGYITSVGAISSYRGVTGIDVFDIAEQGGSAATSYVTGSLTAPADNMFAVSFNMGPAAGSYTPDSDTTERVDLSRSNTYVHSTVEMVDAIVSAGAVQYTATGPNATQRVSFLALLSSPLAMSFTATIDKTLCLNGQVTDTNGSEVQAVTIPGAVSAAAQSVPAGASPWVSIALQARSQVIVRNPTSAVESQTTVPSSFDTTSQQQFTAPSSGTVDRVVLNLDVDTAGPFDLELWSDNGSDAVAVAVSATATTTPGATGDDQEIVFTFTTSPVLVSGQLYWIRLKEAAGAVGQWNSYATKFGTGISGVTGHTFRFQVHANLDQQNTAYANNGDAIVVDDLTANLLTDNAPAIVFGGQEDAYMLDGRLFNHSTSEEIALKRLLTLNDVIEIDTNLRTIRNLSEAALQVDLAGSVVEAASGGSFYQIEGTGDHIGIPSRLLRPDKGWIAIRARTDASATWPSYDPATVWSWRDDASNLLELRYDAANTRWELQRRDAGQTDEVQIADAKAESLEVTLIAKWDDNLMSLSLDGAAFSASSGGSQNNIPFLASPTIWIGSDGTASSQFDGDIEWVAGGRGDITAAQATALHAFGNTDPDEGDIPEAAEMTFLWWARTRAIFAPDFPHGPALGGRIDGQPIFSHPETWMSLAPGANKIMHSEDGLAGMATEFRHLDRWI